MFIEFILYAPYPYCELMLLCVDFLWGLLIAMFIYVVSILLHENAHKAVTVRYIKRCKKHSECHIKFFNKKGKYIPHTESFFYCYLQWNNCRVEAQNMLRCIAIAGYRAGFAWLCLSFVVMCVFSFVFCEIIFLCAAAVVLFFIIADICAYLGSSDRSIYREPWAFRYLY